MDTIKLLLIVTVAFLVGALALSWKDFRQQVKDTPGAELAEVQRQIEEIQMEQMRLSLEHKRIVHGSPETKAPAADDTPSMPQMEQPAAEQPQGLDERPELDFPAFPEDSDPTLSRAPGGSEERALAIRNAPTVAKISEWITNPQIGSFGTIEIIDSAKVTQGTILHLRRNSGILGKLKVNEISPDGGIIGAVTEFGALKPEVGDELILEPVNE